MNRQNRQNRQLPHNLDAERAILASALLDPDAIHAAAEMVQPDDFYSPANGVTWEAILAMAGAAKAVDLVTLRAQLSGAGKLGRAGGDEALVALTETIPHVANITHYAEIVRDRAVARRIIKAAHGIAVDGYDSGADDVQAYADSAESAIMAAAHHMVRTSYEHAGRLVAEVVERAGAIAAGEEKPGAPTGLRTLDRLIKGVAPGQMIVVAGRPSMGKTAVGLTIAEHIALDGGAVGIWSMEMTKSELVARLVSSIGRVDSEHMRDGVLSHEDWSRMIAAAAVLAEIPIWIDDTPGLTIFALRARARRLAVEHGPLGLVMVDYLQLMSGGKRSESRQQDVSDISRGVKEMAKDLGTPVLALSQLNRGVEARGGDKRPILADLRESGSIEQDADVVAMVYRRERYFPDDRGAVGHAELIIAKQRAGRLGTAHLRFEGRYTRFSGYGCDDADG